MPGNEAEVVHIVITARVILKRHQQDVAMRFEYKVGYSHDSEEVYGVPWWLRISADIVTTLLVDFASLSCAPPVCHGQGSQQVNINHHIILLRIQN